MSHDQAPARGESEGPPSALRVGTRVHEFEITGIVGEGGFGIVYLAFDHSLHRVVALKEYMPAALAERVGGETVAVRSERQRPTFAAGLKSFVNEARLLARFDHPALLKVYRFWEGNGTAYMAMPYYQGRTLKQTLVDQPAFATEAALRRLLEPVLDALELLHRNQCFHRDVSPDNIMILENGAPVLLDFGAARRIIGDLTQGVTVILKPGYAPVEQYADDPELRQGPWTDIYAVGAVLYAAIVGKPPPSSVARMVKDPMEPLAGRGLAGFDRAFLAAIDLALAVRPEQRPQSIAAFREALGLLHPAAATASSSPARAGESSREPGEGGSRRPPAASAPLSATGGRSGDDATRFGSWHTPPAAAPHASRPSASEPAHRRLWWPLAGVVLAVAVIAGIYFAMPAGEPDPGVTARTERAFDARSTEQPSAVEKSSVERRATSEKGADSAPAPGMQTPVAPAPGASAGDSPAPPPSVAASAAGAEGGEERKRNETPRGSDAMPRPAEPPSDSTEADRAWASVQGSCLEQVFIGFVFRFPDSPHVAEARNRLVALRAGNPCTWGVGIPEGVAGAVTADRSPTPSSPPKTKSPPAETKAPPVATKAPPAATKAATGGSKAAVASAKAPSSDTTVSASPKAATADAKGPLAKTMKPQATTAKPEATTASVSTPGAGAAGAEQRQSTASAQAAEPSPAPAAKDAPPLPPAMARASLTGGVSLQIRPWGEVYVDGVLRGVSPPLKNFDLPEGRHVVEFRNPGFPMYRREIEVRRSERVSIAHEFR